MRPHHGPIAPEPPETIVVDAMRICCDGGGGALGHPRVWLSVSPVTGYVECGYCDRKFVHQEWVKDAETT